MSPHYDNPAVDPGSGCDCPAGGDTLHCARHGVDKTGWERCRCRVLPAHFWAWEAIARRGSVGATLAGLLRELGVSHPASCNCDQRAAQMDAWGVAGCIEHRTEIVAWLNEQARKASWLESLGAGCKALSMGLVLNPLSPGDGLLDAALRLAEAAMTTQAK